MVTCRECKFLIGYDSVEDIYYCGATSDVEFIDPVWADDEDLGCDLFVDYRNDDTSKKP